MKNVYSVSEEVSLHFSYTRLGTATKSFSSSQIFTSAIPASPHRGEINQTACSDGEIVTGSGEMS